MAKVFLPRMGITYADFSTTLLERCPERFIGSFLVPGGYGFSPYSAPSGWVDSVLLYRETDEPDGSVDAVAEILEYVNKMDHNHPSGLYLQIWIGIMASPSDTTDLTFVVEHTRAHELIQFILPIQKQHDIPVHVDVTDFNQYCDLFKEFDHPELMPPGDLHVWSPAHWEAFCLHNWAEHGASLFERWLKRAPSLAIK